VLLLNEVNSIGRNPGHIVEVDGQSAVFSTGRRRPEIVVDAHCSLPEGSGSGRLTLCSEVAM
jgi:hypothetical protein